MKLCFSTLGCSDLSLEQILSLAHSYGMSAIEIRGIGGVLDNAKIDVFREDALTDTAKVFTESKIIPAVLGTSCSFHNPEKFHTAVSEGLHALKIASSLKIPYIRVFGDKLREDDEAGCISRVISGISQLCDETPDTCVLLEVHGDFNSEKNLLPVIDKLSDKKNFGLIWDIEHTHAGYGDSWQKFYRFARPYIKHVHIKDRSTPENRLTLIGEGDVPIIPITAALLNDGYDGFLSLEWEKKWHPELPDIDSALDSFVKVMNEVRI